MTTGSLSTLSNSNGQYRKLLTHQPHPLKSLDQLAVIIPCHRGQEICSQGEPADIGIASSPVQRDAASSGSMVDVRSSICYCREMYSASAPARNTTTPSRP